MAVNIRVASELQKSEDYRKYHKEKMKIRKRYPKDLLEGKKMSREEHIQYRAYLKEVANLMFEPNGLFQTFIWNNLGETEKKIMESKAKNNKTGGQRKSEFNYY